MTASRKGRMGSGVSTVTDAQDRLSGALVSTDGRAHSTTRLDGAGARRLWVRSVGPVCGPTAEMVRYGAAQAVRFQMFR